MIFIDFEVYKHDWLIVWLDTKTQKFSYIANDRTKLEQFYKKYKDTVMVGYNIRGYDQYILKGILAGFDPYDISDWIINKDRMGWEYSNLLSKFPLLIYDCSYSFRSLKQLEGFMGHDIRETSVSFDIDRKLTDEEMNQTIKYCKHDVNEAFHVFVETASEFESHVGLVKEFNLQWNDISKTKAQLSAKILGARLIHRNDEFDITIPDTIQLGKYEWLRTYYLEWAKRVKTYNDSQMAYSEMELSTDIAGVPHTFGVGGLHGAIRNYIGDGYFLMADVGSYYPALMIEYDFLSRNVSNPEKFRAIRDERMILKRKKDPRQEPRKIVLNSTYGASKDPYNPLYDPLQANNVCIAGQLMLVDLIEKLESHCQVIQSNTDGVLLKLYDKADEPMIKAICDEWGKRVRMTLEFEVYTRVVQKDVNNYIAVTDNGKVKSKGAYVKELSLLDNDLPILNRAVKDYLLYNIQVEQTILSSDKLMDFQQIVKVSHLYEHAVHNGEILEGRVHRVFASKHPAHGTIFKKHKQKDGLDKIASTPMSCFIMNENIENEPLPKMLDKNWYIETAKERIAKFIGD